MTGSYNQGNDGAQRTERQPPTFPNEANTSTRISRQEPQRPLVIYTYSPRTVHVAAHEFKDVVQRLTGKDWYQNNSVQEHSAAQRTLPSHSDRQSQEASEGSTAPQQIASADSHSALEEYLDKLDREDPSTKSAPNLGLFPTAGLVKGVDVDLGLRWGPVVGSATSSSSGPSESSTKEFLACKDNADNNRGARPCFRYINQELGIQFSTRCHCRDTSAAF